MDAAPVGYGVDGAIQGAAPGAMEALQAAVAGMHAMPVVGDAFGAALQAATGPADAAAAMAAAAGAPSGSEGAAGGLHLGSSAMGRPRLSGSLFKNRTGPLYCQVEGCNTPLEGLKEYHQRYKVCEHHLKTPCIVRDGQQVRFCQQCGRFQPLGDFDDNKRSCRVRLQRHNARRRKKPREGGATSGGGGGGGGEVSDYGQSAAAAVEMAKLAAQTYAAAAGAPPPGTIPIAPKEIQDMREALQFASSTLAHSGQAVAGEEGGEAAIGAAGSAPFVPTPDVMMLLLKGYAAMFHYILDGATIRALAPPSELPDQPAGAAGAGLGLAAGAGPLDALQMQQLMQAQAAFGAGGLPGLFAGGDALAAAGLLGAGVEGEDAEGAAAVAGEAGAEGLGDEGAVGEEQQGMDVGQAEADEAGAADVEEQQQGQLEQQAVEAAAAAETAAGAVGLGETQAQQQQQQQVADGDGELGPKQGTVALAQPLPLAPHAGGAGAAGGLEQHVGAALSGAQASGHLDPAGQAGDAMQE